MILNHFQVCDYNSESFDNEQDNMTNPNNNDLLYNDEAMPRIQIPQFDSLNYISKEVDSQNIEFNLSNFKDEQLPSALCSNTDKTYQSQGTQDFDISRLTLPEMIVPANQEIYLDSKPETSGTQVEKEIGLRRGKFTKEEDELLKDLVKKHGRNWALISKFMLLKDRKQLRERYDNFLSKKLCRTPFTEAEDNKILELVEKIGTKFYKMAEEFEGRSAIMIKNRYYSKLLRKRQISVNLSQIFS